MNLTKDQFEGCLEILDRANMLGSTEMMDDELKMDIIESFINCQNLTLYTYENRPIVKYSDDNKELYMYCDSFKDVSEDIINILEEQN